MFADSEAEPGRFFRRFLAYFIDAIPITLITLALYALVFPEFVDVFDAYTKDSQNPEKRLPFLLHRNTIRDLAAVGLVIYGTLLESSPLEGTVGKRLLGMRVHDLFGRRLTLRVAFVRNVTKLLGAGICALGLIWVLFDANKQGWHDKAAYTVVLTGAGPAREDGDALPVGGAMWTVVATLAFGWIAGNVVQRLAAMYGVGA